MRETFDEYKSTLDDLVIKFKYLYDGDIISSKKLKHSTILKGKSNSPRFIIDTIEDIYNESVKNMIEKSVNININILGHVPTMTEIANSIIKIGSFDPTSIFINESFSKYFSGFLFTKGSSKPFSKYMYDNGSIKVSTLDMKLYSLSEKYNIDSKNVIYVVDRSIQSLVYSIQNMEYDVDLMSGGLYKHEITYDMYDCDFKSYRLIFNDLSKQRDDKINEILS